MIYVFLIIAMFLFLASLRFFDIVTKVRLVVSETRDATAVMQSKELNDEQKESALQKAAIGMFGSFWSILVRVSLTVSISVAAVMLGSVLGFYEVENAVRAASDWPFILGSTLVMIGALIVIK